MKRPNRLGAGVIGVGLLVGMLLGVPASAAPDDSNTQSEKTNKVAAAAASDQCLMMLQSLPGVQRYRNANNMYGEYFASTHGGNWFNVACGAVTFVVPAGQEALVDLTATAELDCRGPAGWCGGRFHLTGLSPARPDNGGRGDPYAWDNSVAGTGDWAAHTLRQVARLVCPSTTNGCSYTATLQSNFVGADSLWVDDLTMVVDVMLGAVQVSTGNPYA